MGKYYDGTKLLNKLDLDGEKPEIYFAAGNRTSGKTTWFSKLLVDKWINHGEKFCLLYRFNYELEDVADKFFKDIGSLFFPEYTMTQKLMSRGVYANLYLNDIHCGYAVALNGADQIKKMSHMFSDVQHMFMDEFQSESAKYCAREIEKFISVHTSMARGQGQQSRHLPVYMAANCVSLLNPYYAALRISDRLKAETKFLRGRGFVLEQSFVAEAATALQMSGFAKAFAKEEYISYGAQNVYLRDNDAFVDNVLGGRPSYIATLRYKGNLLAVKAYNELGVVYCDTRADKTFPTRISVTTDDHNINYVMLKQFDMLIYQLRYFFDKGCFRFKNLLCKEAIMKAIAYY